MIKNKNTLKPKKPKFLSKKYLSREVVNRPYGSRFSKPFRKSFGKNRLATPAERKKDDINTNVVSPKI
jgi:hypothetical protein